jgi:phasin protein
MSNRNQNKPGSKSGQRGRKPVQEPSLKAEQPQSPEPEHHLNQEPLPPQSQEPVLPQTEKPEQQVANEPIAAIVAPANNLAIDFQTIATAYSDYSKKSFEQIKAYVQKLAGVRSLDKAIEIQTEFAKQAYETFMTESQKISGLYSGLAMQSFKPLESMIAKTMPVAR